MADDAGALLVRSGLVPSSALDEARSRVASGGGTIGEQLVAEGAISDDALTDFYRQRLLVPQVNPNTLARLPQKVVTAIPGDMAIELRAIPVSLDGDNNLTVAMSDPSDRHAVDEISFFTGAYVVRAVATQMQIAWCLAHYYGHVTALGARLIQPQKAAGAAGAAAATRVASATAAAAAATATARAPRVKGFTGRVDAARHHAIAPGGGPIEVVRPLSSELDLAALQARAGDANARADADARAADTDADADADVDVHVVMEADEPPDDGDDGAAASAPAVARPHRAASIKPPMPDPHLGEDEDDEPMISIEAGAADAAGAAPGPRMVPVRRRVKSDPPELKARAGEVSSGARPERLVDDQPRIIIDDEALVPVGPVSGELRAATQRDEDPAPASTIEVDETSVGVVIADLVDETSVGVVIADLAGEVSEPVLLERRRTNDLPVATLRAPSSEDGLDTTDDEADDEADEETDEEIVVLEARKPTPTPTPGPRPEKRTQVGVGAIAALTRLARDGRRTPAPTPAPGEPPAARPHLEDDDVPTRVDGRAAPPRDDDDTTDETLAAPPPPPGADTSPHLAPAPAPAGGRRRAASIRPISAPPLRAIPRDDDEAAEDDALGRGPATSVMSAVELDDVIPERRDDVVPAHLARRRVESDPLDDGWGPPGTTIPPPLLGALPGIDEDAEGEDPSKIPVANVNTAPLIVAPPSPPESARGAPALPETGGLVRALEDATSRAVQLIHALERAKDRDAVVTLMIEHLGESHVRAGFLAIRPSAEGGKAGELAVFRIEPAPPSPPAMTLRLDRPSTLQDVVGTRLPYRGPMHDDASRSFLAGVLGACPPEILLVPVTVRERVVGVLFGEHRLRHTFDDQLALAARAAGMALERILLAKRG